MAIVKKVAYAIVDSVVLGEKVKPVQEAVRRVLYRYRISEERVFRRVGGIVYNVFRSQGLADYIVEKLTGIKIDELDPWGRGVLRVAAYISQLDKATSDRAKEALKRHLVSYALKRLRDRDRVITAIEALWGRKWEPGSGEEELMVRYRIHPGLYKLLEDAFKALSEDVDSFLKATLKPPPYHVLRVNRLKASPQAILEYLRKLGCRVSQSPYSPSAIRYWGSLSDEAIRLIETGIVTPQDEASMVAVELIPLKPGAIVADLCAAPGNKTSYLAELAGLNVSIHAFDVNRDRIKRMRRLLERTSAIKAVRIHHMDARNAPELLGRESVDIALVDPPCSSTGAIARNPEVRWRYNPRELSRINRLQKEILEAAYRLVKPGGYIMYTTCSVLPSEGEHVVTGLLSRHSDIEVVYIRGPFSESPILPGTMRSYPHVHGVTGFYYALLRRRTC